MADAGLRAAPMPWPMSRYHGPRSAAMSMPACFHKASSAWWVPERSPRDTKGAPFAWMAFRAVTMSLLPLMPAGSLSGPIRTELLYIPRKRFPPGPFLDEFLLGGARMHQGDVGVAAARGVERLAGALRDHPHVDAGRLPEDRQDVDEPAGGLGRGGGGHGD